MEQQQSECESPAGGLDGSGLHIALVHWAFPPSVGGVETHLWEYSRALARRNHRVTIFTGTADSRPPCSGVDVFYHPLLDLSVDRVDSDASVRQLSEWFADHLTAGGQAVRLVHGHNLHHFSNVPALALDSLRGRLGLVLPHTYHSIWRDPDNEKLARECAVWDAHHAVSDFLVHECSEVLTELKEPVTRTYLGIDASTYLDVGPLEQNDNRPVILLPARLIPNKGAVVAVEMLAELIERAKKSARALRPRLVLTNPGDTVDFHDEAWGFKERLLDLMKRRDLESDDVEFRAAGIDDMRGLYEEASVVIYPSRFNEPMGLAPLEAMCAARPVVATGIGGLGEGGSALVEFQERDDEPALVQRFADEVWQLLMDPAEARAAGLRGREHVQKHFDLEEVYVDQMLTEYQRLLDGAPQSDMTRQPSGSSVNAHSPEVVTATDSR
ncbi:glycosyltransferase family 4 protein [Streptomyces sp. NPDC005374]|uniref:glycosyltransferase family 4 protein n=1 Tax=Streptomyces sp. NPDC005374 TaxID=3364713 RepID=UPI0036CBBC6A